MDSIFQLIEKVGLFALGVAAVWVAILIVVSFIDRNPRRETDGDRAPHSDPPAKDKSPK